MYLDGLGKFLVIFVQKYIYIYIFFTLLKKFWAKKSLFGNFSKMQFLNKKSDDLNRFLVKFPFIKIYSFIYLTSLVFKLCQKQFSQKPTILRGWHHP